MRHINKIVVHCTATKEGLDIDRNIIRSYHIARGFKDFGYHYLIKLDGTVQIGRLLSDQGAHVRGYNQDSIGVAYVGGLDLGANPKDTRTPEQKKTLKSLIATLVDRFPGVEIVGHRDLSPDLDGDGRIEPQEWLKACPCFDVKQEFS